MPGNAQRWYRIEVATRRLFFTLARLQVQDTDPARGHKDPGPVYEFLADQPGRPVMTGHADGVITLNVAEADDDERVRRRVAMHEPYRTLLGHLRHESGHDQLVAQWVPLTLMVNSLNRSLGHEDAYSFALSPTAIGKLRHVHDAIRAAHAGR